MKSIIPVIMLCSGMFAGLNPVPMQQVFAQDKNPSASVNMRTLGVRINVTDMDKALAFYTGKLGFTVQSKEFFPEAVFLNTQSKDKLMLHKVSNLMPVQANDAHCSLTLQVNNIDESIQRLKQLGVEFAEKNKRKEGVGYSITFKDPFGTGISMMQETVSNDTSRFVEPKIYNYGYFLPNMSEGIDFYSSKLGFVQRSQRYLPLDMPLGHTDKTFGFMLHYRENIEPIRYNTSNDEPIVILFQTNALDATMSSLRAQGVNILQKQPQQHLLGKFVSFRDPSGYVSDIVEIKFEIK